MTRIPQLILVVLVCALLVSCADPDRKPTTTPEPVIEKVFDIKAGEELRDVITKWGYPTRITNPHELPGIRVEINKESPIYKCTAILVYDDKKAEVALSADTKVVGVFEKLK